MFSTAPVFSAPAKEISAEKVQEAEQQVIVNLASGCSDAGIPLVHPLYPPQTHVITQEFSVEPTSESFQDDGKVDIPLPLKQKQQQYHLASLTCGDVYVPASLFSEFSERKAQNHMLVKVSSQASTTVLAEQVQLDRITNLSFPVHSDEAFFRFAFGTMSLDEVLDAARAVVHKDNAVWIPVVISPLSAFVSKLLHRGLVLAIAPTIKQVTKQDFDQEVMQSMAATVNAKESSAFRSLVPQLLHYDKAKRLHWVIPMTVLRDFFTRFKQQASKWLFDPSQDQLVLRLDASRSLQDVAAGYLDAEDAKERFMVTGSISVILEPLASQQQSDAKKQQTAQTTQPTKKASKKKNKSHKSKSQQLPLNRDLGPKRELLIVED